MRYAIFLVLIALGACKHDAPVAPTAAQVGATVRVDGTVHLIDVEGGCWVIDTAQGRVQPVDLPERFRKEGLAVRVSLRDAPDMASVCQAGALKHVDTIETR